MASSRRVNVKPRFWGAHGWAYLWAIGLGFPESPTADESARARRFLEAMGDLLPCLKCRTHYAARAAAHPDAVATAAASGTHFRTWVLDLHNAIRATHGREPLAEADATAYFLTDTVVDEARARRAARLIPAAHVCWVVPLAIVVGLAIGLIVAKCCSL